MLKENQQNVNLRKCKVGQSAGFYQVSCQFYQHFMRAFCADILVAKNFKPKTIFGAKISVQNARIKC